MDVRPVTLELNVARLEPLSLSHAPGLLEAARDESIWTFMPYAGPRDEPEVHAYIQRALDAAAAGSERPFAIVHRPSGRVAGSTRYMEIRRADRALEIGATWVGAPWRRTGLNTECKYLLLRHAFETLGAVRVQLKTDARNQRSRAAILRIGASYEGRLRRHRLVRDGFVRDTVYYSVIAEEWPDVRSRLEAMIAGSR